MHHAHLNCMYVDSWVGLQIYPRTHAALMQLMHACLVCTHTCDIPTGGADTAEASLSGRYSLTRHTHGHVICLLLASPPFHLLLLPALILLCQVDEQLYRLQFERRTSETH